MLPVGLLLAGVAGSIISSIDLESIVPSEDTRAANAALDELIESTDDRVPWGTVSGGAPIELSCETELVQTSRIIATTSERASVLLDELVAELESGDGVELYQLADDPTTLHAARNSGGVLVELQAGFSGPRGSIELTGTAGECVDGLDPIPDGATLGWPETRFQSTQQSVDLDLLLAEVELPTSRSLRYDLFGEANQWPGCPGGTAQATGLSGGDADTDGWIDEQAEILQAAGFETRTIRYIKSTDFRPDADTSRLLAVNDSAALILEAESRENFELYQHAIIFGSCVEDAGLGLIELDPNLVGVQFLEDSGLS